MLGLSVASKIINIRPVGGPGNTWNKGEHPDINHFMRAPRPSRQQPPWFVYSQIVSVFSALTFGWDTHNKNALQNMHSTRGQSAGAH